MGSGASAGPAEGAAINPRVEYTAKLAQSVQKQLVIDVPALFKGKEGSVRYRYVPSAGAQPEQPHQGSESLGFKKGYFYHAKLKDYSDEGLEKPDIPAYQGQYVIKGPNAARNKRIYFITNQGKQCSLAATSSFSVRAPTWPNIEVKKERGYYDIIVQPTDEDVSETVGSENLNLKTSIFMIVSADETIKDLKLKISMRNLIPANHIHIFHKKREIIEDLELSSLAITALSGSQNLKILLASLL